jgi:hypothetical protein
VKELKLFGTIEMRTMERMAPEVCQKWKLNLEFVKRSQWMDARRSLRSFVIDAVRSEHQPHVEFVMNVMPDILYTTSLCTIITRETAQ